MPFRGAQTSLVTKVKVDPSHSSAVERHRIQRGLACPILGLSMDVVPCRAPASPPRISSHKWPSCSCRHFTLFSLESWNCATRLLLALPPVPLFCLPPHLCSFSPPLLVVCVEGWCQVEEWSQLMGRWGWEGNKAGSCEYLHPSLSLFHEAYKKKREREVLPRQPINLY